MSKSSVICIKEADFYKCIYCYSGSELKNNGFILSNYYDSKEKVESLLSFGDLCYLGSDINKETIANFRALEFEFLEPETVRTLKKVVNLFWLCSYIYVFYKNKWFYNTWNGFNSGKRFKPIDSEII